MRHLTLLLLLSSLLAACVDVPARPPEQPEDTGIFEPEADAAGGSTEDTAIAPEDVATSADATPTDVDGLTQDAAVDAPQDISIDAPEDTAEDTAADTSPDIASPDAAEDAAQPDVAPDAPAPDAAADADLPDPCNGRTPGREVCDGIDNDCDGLIDEDEQGQPRTLPCYSGPADTEGQGTCRAGVRLCVNGVYHACTGEQPPTPETCDGLDNDCDGLTDEDDQGVTLAEVCFAAAPELIDQGICRAGTRTCTAGGWTACAGQVLPQPEACDGIDNDCDGAVDLDPQGATLALPCYDGPPNTAGVSSCTAGLLACVNGVYTSTCEGQIIPTEETCDGADNDCDGIIDEDDQGVPLRVSCYDGPERTIGIGPCRSGQRQCSNGSYGACTDQLIPSQDSCDGVDNDCDGTTDEGVLNACGGCAANCQQTLTGGCPTCNTFDPVLGDNAEDVQIDREGLLTLLQTKGENTGVAWIVSSGSNKQVYKLDAVTGRQIGRYRTPYDPSSTVIDNDGNAFIALRGSGKVMKISNWTTSCDENTFACNCYDRNGDGIINTSKDTNGNGIIDNSEFLDNGNNCADDSNIYDCFDECIDWVSDVGGIPRGLAIDLNGFLWVGSETVETKLNTINGQIELTLNTTVKSYNSAMDSNGIIWIGWISENCIQGINTQSNEIGPRICAPWSDRSSAGIAVDSQGRVYQSSYCISTYIASRYDPVANYWTKVLMPTGTTGGCTRGVTVDSQDIVWVSHWLEGGIRVTGFSSDFSNTPDHRPVPVKDIYHSTSNCSGSLAIGVISRPDGDQVWNTCYNSARVAITSTDPAITTSTYHPIGPTPYVYSDFTGNRYQTFTAPRGTLTDQLEGCPGSSVNSWVALDWSATTPPGTQVAFKVRTATSLQALASAPWSMEYVQSDEETAAPVDLSALPVQAFMEIQIELEASEAGAAPRVYSYNVTRYCN